MAHPLHLFDNNSAFVQSNGYGIFEEMRHQCAAQWDHEPKVFAVQDGLMVYEPEPGEPYLTVVSVVLQKTK